MPRLRAASWERVVRPSSLSTLGFSAAAGGGDAAGPRLQPAQVIGPSKAITAKRRRIALMNSPVAGATSGVGENTSLIVPKYLQKINETSAIPLLILVNTGIRPRRVLYYRRPRERKGN